MLLARNDREVRERKRCLVFLVMKFLSDEGYLAALEALQKDSNSLLSEKVMDENLTLPTLLKDYEEYFELRYGKRPRFYSSSGAPPKAKLPALPRPADKPQNANPNAPPRPESKELRVSGQKLSAAEPLPGALPARAARDGGQGAFRDFPASLSCSEELLGLARGLQSTIVADLPPTELEQIVGLEAAKEALFEAVTLPALHPELFAGGLLEPWRGALLFGPPGTGKTLLSRAVASQCRATFFNVTAASLVSKFHGESEKSARVLFELARHHAPAIVFVDEIDALMGRRGAEGPGHEAARRLKTEILLQMDGLLSGADSSVFVLAATNRPWDLDPAFLRRLEKRVFVPLPSAAERLSFLRKFFAALKSVEAVNFRAAAAATHGYSFADLKAVCKQAVMSCVRAEMRARPAQKIDARKLALSSDCLPRAIASVKACPNDEQEKFQKWNDLYSAL